MALKNLLYQCSLRIVPVLYSVLSNIVFSTCKVREHGRENLDACKRSGPFTVAVWHYAVLVAVSRMRGMDWVVMVSGSKDAEYVSQLMKRMKIETVRGSRGKGGLKAIQEMGRLMKDGEKNAAIIADGSQGPPRVAQAGAVLLASKTGAPILPIAWSAKRYKAFRSWDRTIFPLPFSEVSLWYGKPIMVPEKLKAADLEHFRLEMEKSLNDLYGRAWECYGRKSHYSDD
jgi:hypothetical protein